MQIFNNNSNLPTYSNDDIIKIIMSGCKFKYKSYDHKKAVEEWNANLYNYDKEFNLMIGKPSCYDLPESLKDKYKIEKIGKLRAIFFDNFGNPWKFRIGNKYAKTFFVHDFGVNVFPMI